MRVRINGEDQEITDGVTVSGLLVLLNVKPERVAVERNRLVVRRGTYDDTRLSAGDEIEILTFVGGG